jgi:predicted RNA binding protein YcfA (HicA-like mRNA interferase family)
MTPADLIRVIEKDGWTRTRMRGSHRMYTHPHKRGVVTVRRHVTDQVAPAALHAVLRQAGLKP